MYYLFMDFVIIILEAVCCQIFFEVFHNVKGIDNNILCRRVIAVLLMSGSCYVAARVFNDMILLKQIVMFLLIVSIMTFVRSIPFKKSDGSVFVVSGDACSYGIRGFDLCGNCDS